MQINIYIRDKTGEILSSLEICKTLFTQKCSLNVASGNTNILRIWGDASLRYYSVLRTYSATFLSINILNADVQGVYLRIHFIAFDGNENSGVPFIWSLKSCRNRV